MSLAATALSSRGRIFSNIGLPMAQEAPVVVRTRPARSWKRALKRLVAPVALLACDVAEVTIEAAGFGLLMVGFLFTIYMLG